MGDNAGDKAAEKTVREMVKDPPSKGENKNVPEKAVHDKDSVKMEQPIRAADDV